MSVIKLIRSADNDWTVWIGLNDDMEPPEGFSFVIGSGETPDAARADAAQDLEDALEQLRSGSR